MKKVLIFLVVLCGMLSLVGCGGDEKKDGLKSGFVVNEGELQSFYYCAFSTDKTKYDIDNVSVQFYYGCINAENQSVNDKFDLEFRLFVSNGTTNTMFKTIDQVDFYDEQYSCRLMKDESGIERIEYTHHELVTISKTLFDKASGEISLSIKEYITQDELEDRYGSSDSVTFKYTKDNNQIVLSEK